MAELVAAGATDQAVVDALGGLSRMAVSRHRHNHLVAPARALAEAAGKGQDAREKRAEVLAAAEAGDPSAFVALAGIVNDLRTVHERLERTAGAAEQDNQRLAVASLSSQQLRAAEVRAKIGGVGAYAPPRVREVGEGVAFAVNFIFSDGHREQIVAVPTDGAPTIDAEPTASLPFTIGRRLPTLIPEDDEEV